MITKGRSDSADPLSLTLAYVKESRDIATVDLESDVQCSRDRLSICTSEEGEKNSVLTCEEFGFMLNWIERKFDLPKFQRLDLSLRADKRYCFIKINEISEKKFRHFDQTTKRYETKLFFAERAFKILSDYALFAKEIMNEGI